MNAAECLPAQFNVATYFVDRHLEEGRAGAPAFFCEERTLTYGDVADLANRAGVRKNDILIAFDGRSDLIRETDVIAYALRNKQPGERVALTFLRDGKTQTLSFAYPD